MRLTLRQLELFCAIAQTGSTIAAAEAVSLSQSATSAALKELEQALDTRLFDRVSKRLVLNDQGRALWPEALSMLEKGRSIEESFSGRSPALPTRLKIAASTTVGNYFLPALMGTFRAQLPRARFNVWIGNTLDVGRLVAGFEADLGMIEGPCHVPDLTVLAWRSDALVIVASPRHPLAIASLHQPLTIEQMRNASWLLREPGSGTGEAVEQALTQHLDYLQPDLMLGSSEAIKNAVAEGIGISCLPRVLVQDFIASGRLQVLDTTLPILSRQFSLVHRQEKKLSSMLESFVHTCQASAHPP